MENSNYKNKKIDRKYFNTRYDWLIDYIPEHIRKCEGSFKVVSPFKTNTPNQVVYGREKKQTKSTKTSWREHSYKH